MEPCYICGKELVGITEAYAAKENGQDKVRRGFISKLLFAAHKDCLSKKPINEPIHCFRKDGRISDKSLLIAWDNPSVNQEFMEA